MKKVAVAFVAILSLIVLAEEPAFARGRGGGGGGGSHGGGSHGGGAHVGGGSHGGGRGGFHGHGGAFQGRHGYRHGGWNHGYRGRAFVGGVYVGGWPYWDPYPYYYGYPYYSSAYQAAYAAPVVAEPMEYVQQQGGAGSYWYFCESAYAYYPYVRECPGGWLTVVPSAPTDAVR